MSDPLRYKIVCLTKEKRWKSTSAKKIENQQLFQPENHNWSTRDAVDLQQDKFQRLPNSSFKAR